MIITQSPLSLSSSCNFFSSIFNSFICASLSFSLLLPDLNHYFLAFLCFIISISPQNIPIDSTFVCVAVVCYKVAVYLYSFHSTTLTKFYGFEIQALSLFYGIGIFFATSNTSMVLGVALALEFCSSSWNTKLNKYPCMEMHLLVLITHLLFSQMIWTHATSPFLFYSAP